MKQRSSLFIFVFYLLFHTPVSAQEKSEHFGFEFLSDYSSCLEISRSKADDKIYIDATSTREPGSLVEIPSIKFGSAFGGYRAMTKLVFTPISKKLYSIVHVIRIEDRENAALVFSHINRMMQKKYGLPSGLKYPKSLNSDPELKELFSHMPTQAWKTKSIIIDMMAFLHLKDTADGIIINYDHIEGKQIFLKEQKLLEKNLHQDI